ncbi:MAG: T9SS type A sorting domain-containing protein [Flavobacteriales bacterium]|nr:T9SS type A sorting domain-containing protein [Flavobacteriales bacterium]
MEKIITALLFVISVVNYGQNDRKVVILDMTDANSETNYSRYYAADQLMKVTGLSYDSTSLLSEALSYPIVVLGTRIVQDAFSTNEIQLIEDYVSNGGVLIMSNLRDTNFKFLAGVDSIISDNELYSITWDTANYPAYFGMIDDSMEVTISLGRESSGPTFYSRSFTTTTSETLGYFENGKSACVHNQIGLGHVYTFGSDFRDLIFRPRINQDINAHRVYSNGFEPSSDAIVIIVRNIIEEHLSNAVYKYTVPGNYSSVICITHDIDSRTGIDTMASFVDAEVARGFKAHYNVTVRYLSDGWMTNFYVGSHQQIAYIRDQGHTLASHSVGHFPDFANATVFPYGSIGNNAANYQPVYFSGMTIGGSVLGETEVSKGLLEDDFSVRVRSWRSGHLAYPDSLAMALDELGYDFSSTYSSNDILTNFPFYAIHDGSFQGYPSNVLEIPMTISDVFASDPISELNFMDKVGIWSDVNKRYDKNNSSLVLLIHPNRGWKLIAQEAFLDSLMPTQGVVSFEEYGDFWRKRDSLNYHSELISGGTGLVVYMDGEIHPQQSFVIDTTGLNEVSFYDQFGIEMNFNSQSFSGSKLLFYQDDWSAIVSSEEDHKISVFPNPTGGKLIVQINSLLDKPMANLYDLTGKLILTRSINSEQSEIFLANDLENGVYLLELQSVNYRHLQKIILQR